MTRALSLVHCWTALCLLGLCTSVFAAELDKRQVRALGQATKSLGKTEGKISGFEGEKRYSDRAGESLSRALAAAKQKLSGLPSEDTRVAEALARIKAAEARVEALVQAKGTLGAKSGLGSKAAKALNHLENSLNNLQNDLGKEGGITERNKPRLERQISEIKSDLAEFPAENAVVKGLLARAAAAEARLGGLKDELAAAQKSSADAAARRQALVSHSSYAKDVERVEALSEAFKERWIWDLSARYLRSSYNTSSYDEALEAAKAWRARKSEWDALRIKYADLLGGFREGSGVWPLKHDMQRVETYGAAIAVFLVNGQAQLQSRARKARELAKQAVAEKNHTAFSRWDSDLKCAQVYTERVAEILLALSGPDQRGVAKSLAKDLAREEEKLAEVIVAANRAPADAYTGGDAGALRGFVMEQWKKHFPAEEVLAIRFPEESLHRTVAWRWNAGSKEHYKVDHSQMWIRVIVKRGAEAVIYRALVRRLHLMQDKLNLRWARPERVPPSSRMLVKNLN